MVVPPSSIFNGLDLSTLAISETVLDGLDLSALVLPDFNKMKEMESLNLTTLELPNFHGMDLELSSLIPPPDFNSSDVPLNLKGSSVIADTPVVVTSRRTTTVNSARAKKLKKLLQLRKQLDDHHRRSGKVRKEEKQGQKEHEEELLQKEQQQAEQQAEQKIKHVQEEEEDTLQQFKQKILSSKMYKKLNRLDSTTALPKHLVKASLKKYKVSSNCHRLIQDNLKEHVELSRDFLDSDSEMTEEDPGDESISKPVSVKEFLHWLED